MGISWEYLWDILGISRVISWENLGDILAITVGYIWDIFGISLGYLGDIFKVIKVINWAIGPLVHWSSSPVVHCSIGPMSNVNKVKLLSERTSGVPLVIFPMVVKQIISLISDLFQLPSYC